MAKWKRLKLILTVSLPFTVVNAFLFAISAFSCFKQGNINRFYLQMIFLLINTANIIVYTGYIAGINKMEKENENKLS